MTNQLKTEIEKINQGCGERIFPKENPDNIKCGTIWNKRVHLCPSCQKYKQGLIKGAKMMIEDEIKDWEDLLWILKDTVHKRVEDIINRKLTELKQLNNWLEKNK